MAGATSVSTNCGLALAFCSSVGTNPLAVQIGFERRSVEDFLSPIRTNRSRTVELERPTDRVEDQKAAEQPMFVVAEIVRNPIAGQRLLAARDLIMQLLVKADISNLNSSFPVYRSRYARPASACQGFPSGMLALDFSDRPDYRAGGTERPTWQTARLTRHPIQFVYTENSTAQETMRMTPDPQHLPMFRIDVSADASSSQLDDKMDTGDLLVALLRQVISNQDQQNQLLSDLNNQLSAAQRQRAQELGPVEGCQSRSGSCIAVRLPKRSAAYKLSSCRI